MPRGKHRKRADKRDRERSIATAAELAQRERARAKREQDASEQYARINALEIQVRAMALELDATTSEVREQLHHDIKTLIGEIEEIATRNAAKRRHNDRRLANAQPEKLDDLEELLPDDATILVGIDEKAAKKLPSSAVRAIQRARGYRKPT